MFNDIQMAMNLEITSHFIKTENGLLSFFVMVYFISCFIVFTKVLLLLDSFIHFKNMAEKLKKRKWEMKRK